MLQEMVNPLVPCAITSPRVWDNDKMKAAVAAATGRNSNGGTKQDRVIVSKGGVEMDVRMTKARELMRADLLDAADRMGLPLIQ